MTVICVRFTPPSSFWGIGLCAISKTIRQLSLISTDHSPTRFPLYGCNRKAGSNAMTDRFSAAVSCFILSLIFLASSPYDFISSLSWVSDFSSLLFLYLIFVAKVQNYLLVRLMNLRFYELFVLFHLFVHLHIFLKCQIVLFLLICPSIDADPT